MKVKKITKEQCKMIMEIEKFIVDNKIYNYSVLIDILSKSNNNVWLKCVRTHTYDFNMFINSLYFSSKERRKNCE